METVEEILHLEELLHDLAQQRAALARQSEAWCAVDAAYHSANDELRQLMASLSPEDEAWLDVEHAGIRHGVSRNE